MFHMPPARAIEVLAAVALTVAALTILASQRRNEEDAPEAAITAPDEEPAGRAANQLPAARQAAAPADRTGKAGKSPRTEFPR
jgi:hypothetical protein